MKNRASLLLMEQLIMVLVFALSATICLQIFVKADAISRTTARTDAGVVLAQNGAEILKSCGGDLEQAAQLLGGTLENGSISVSRDGLRLELKLLPEKVPGLGQAEVCVLEADTPLFSLTVSWQEVAP